MTDSQFLLILAMYCSIKRSLNADDLGLKEWWSGLGFAFLVLSWAVSTKGRAFLPGLFSG